MEKKFAGIPLEKTIIIGAINLSPQTFYKKSLVKNAEEAAKKAGKMSKNGAEIIDLGGMSTGPNAKPVSVREEKRCLLPAVESVREKINIPISVDTQRAEVAKEALEKGANIVNDVSGFKADNEMPKIAAEFGCSAILMANNISGRIRTAEKERNDIAKIKDIKEALEQSLKICEKNGVDLNEIAVDPAIGFGKGAEADLRVIANIDRLLELGRPICVGVSRKSFIGKTLSVDSPRDRLWGSLGATAVTILKGVNLVRTHDPAETSQLVRMIESILEEEVIEWN